MDSWKWKRKNFYNLKVGSEKYKKLERSEANRRRRDIKTQLNNKAPQAISRIQVSNFYIASRAIHIL